jgi:membrane associated rhomboid family serine protease
MEYAGPRVLPPRPFVAAALMCLFTAGLYVLEVYDLMGGGRLERNDCIVPRDPQHLDGILFAPLLHAGWAHLDGNAPFFLVLGFLAMAGGFGQFFVVTLVIWLVSGFGVWLISPTQSCTVGASGVIFGWMTFLLVRGFYARSGKQILVALVLFFFWGSLLLGAIPGDPKVSWQAHLFGALGGILAARLVARRIRPPAPSPELPGGPVMPR